MNLHAYPRPPQDTGIGIHWSAAANACPLDEIEKFWLPELRALGVKWVKIAHQRNAAPLARALLAGQIMPIVQIVRSAPAPGHLSPEELTSVEELIRLGVRYFEFNSEPDRPSNWGRGRLPANALTVTAQHALTDLRAILARGGYPAIPALTPEGDWQLAREIHRLSGDSLFDEPIWLAIHNFSSNRPVAYPYEPGHVEGAPLTQELYYTLAEEAWEEDPWQGRELGQINELRRQIARQPAASRELPLDLPPDRVHWRAFELLDEQMQKLIGRSLPILSTACGYRLGEVADPRYPATTPLLHTAQTLEICRALMGTSSRIPPAPDYYFCTAFWLLGNDALASERAGDERNAWYSPAHPESVLPIVPALKREPKQPRAILAARRRPDDGQERLVFFPAPAGRLRPSGQGIITGKVRGGAGAELQLTHSDGLAYGSIARPDGSFRFIHLPPGQYSLAVAKPAGSRVDGIELAAAGEVSVPLAAYGWGFEIERQPSDRSGMLTCGVEIPPGSTAGTPALRISGGGQESRVVPLIRSSQSLVVRCEVGPLPSGDYRLEVLGLPDVSAASIRCRVQIGRGTATSVLFVHSYAEAKALPKRSVIRGTLRGQERHKPAEWAVRLRTEDGREQLAQVEKSGQYRFEGLAGGTYFVDIPGSRLLNPPGPLCLDGVNELSVDLRLAPADPSPAPPVYASLRGRAAPGAIEQVALLDGQGRRFVARVSRLGVFEFDCLPPGVYELHTDGFVRPGLVLAGGDRLLLQLPETGEAWRSHIRIRTARRKPGQIRVQWLGRAGLPVTVTAIDSGVEEIRQTGTAADFGPYAVAFGPFPPGVYRIRAQGLATSAQVELAPEQSAVVTFLRDYAPAGPGDVRVGSAARRAAGRVEDHKQPA